MEVQSLFLLFDLKSLKTQFERTKFHNFHSPLKVNQLKELVSMALIHSLTFLLLHLYLHMRVNKIV